VYSWELTVRKIVFSHSGGQIQNVTLLTVRLLRCCLTAAEYGSAWRIGDQVFFTRKNRTPASFDRRLYSSPKSLVTGVVAVWARRYNGRLNQPGGGHALLHWQV
jgi:hypothetical protein